MKKIALLALFELFAIGLWCQLPNPGFEAWVEQELYEDPQGWRTNNGLFPYDPPAQKDSVTAIEGNFSLLLRSGCPSFELYHCPGYVKTTIPLNGQIPHFLYAQGACLTTLLSNEIIGYCEAEINLRKDGQVLSSHITTIDTIICQTQECFENLPSMFHLLTMPVNPSGITSADSLEVIFRSIPIETGVGGGLALFYLDQLSLAFGSTAADEASGGLVVSIGPNPTNGLLFGSLPTIGDFDISLYHCSGTPLQQFSLQKAGSFQMDLSGFPAGIYVIQVVDRHSKEKQRLRVLKTN